jgi:DNA modification methylase
MNTRDITVRNDAIIKKFIDDFSLDKKPIEVSFRKLLPEINNIDRFTHLIHAYPAKLLVHIPYFFLNNSVFSKKNDNVLDPFNGSGTVLLESILSHRNAFGADANPLARLIAEVKVSNLDTEKLSVTVKKTVTTAKQYKRSTFPDVVNCDYWFPKKSQDQLAKLLTAINKIEDEKIKKFMLVSFSNCVKKVSYADPKVSVPVKLNPQRYEKGSKEEKKIHERLEQLEKVDVFEKFISVATENIKRFKELERAQLNGNIAKIVSTDARALSVNDKGETILKEESIQLIITSPPYAGAQKYIRASSLNLGWTQLAKTHELLLLDKKNIGRENYRKAELYIKKTGIVEADTLIEKIFKIKPERAKIFCSYLLEMKDALNEMVRVLKKDGYLVLIVGNNKVCNKEFNTQEYFTECLISKGLKLQFKLIDDIRSYGLMTKRNKTADIISREWILVFKK